MTEPWLYLSRMTVNGEPREFVDDAHAPSLGVYGSCRRQGHALAWRSPAQQRAIFAASGGHVRMALYLD